MGDDMTGNVVTFRRGRPDPRTASDRPPDTAKAPRVVLPPSVTILLVEDSRFACDAIRLLCQASGIRIRRADCLQSARRHLATYRPSLVMVDLGLPDGSGMELVAELRQQAACPAIIAISGDDTRMKEALVGGADGFVTKPFASLAAFQRVLRNGLGPETSSACRMDAVDHGLPASAAPSPEGPAAVCGRADRLTYHDDLRQAGRLMDKPGEAHLPYIAQFVGGLARSNADEELERAATELAHRGRPGLSNLRQAVHARLASTPLL